MGIKNFFRKIHSKESKIKTQQGKPIPLGATFYENSINFAVFAAHASRVSLLLYNKEQDVPFEEISLDPKIHKTGDVWHILVSGISRDIQYGYRVGGENRKDHYYSEDNILLDPYAHALYPTLKWGWSTEITQKNKRITISRSCLVDHAFDWQDDAPPLIPMHESILYEFHVRGFSRHASSKSKYSGTYKGIIEKIPYLKDLGITAIELLPVFEFDETDNGNYNPETGEKLKNFWGYSTISFFVPKASYAFEYQKNAHILEFKEMVRELHKAKIEVILDVVFNHTAEGDQRGPTLSFRGLDNCVYYLLTKEGEYMNFSGCGNSVKANHPVVSDFIIDCLRYWVLEMHVDGFRFDLASILTRDEKGIPMADPPVIKRIALDPILKNVKLIAEAWDAGGLYQVGSFPSYGRWSEWNGKFRDDVRAFIKGDNGVVHALAARLIGSPDLYGEKGRPPSHSINFITCHDGFTLNDLVSYNKKKNTMNGEENRDGEQNNLSWNCGEEGESKNPIVLKLREKQRKNFMAILLLSQGVPMLLGGDEFGRTQQGNNNAYCQDNEISWIDWDLLEKNAAFLRFVKEMIALRKRHFQAKDFQDYQISWHGVKVGRPDWSYHSHSLALLIEQTKKTKDTKAFYIILNAFWMPLTFDLPKPSSDKVWHILMDTAKESPLDITTQEDSAVWKEKQYTLEPRSVVVLITMPVEGKKESI
ncbi:MAG: glycogen debranching protein GlgX [Candidatus Brocadiae bacterium]|nr:glycogen debranching protein GlgX [Candidatus Brocadiia bacterium]